MPEAYGSGSDEDQVPWFFIALISLKFSDIS